MDVIVLTGYSGAGKSVALKALEDVGLVCMDNLPLGCLPHVVSHLASQLTQLVLCVDTRTPDFDAESCLRLLAHLREEHVVRLCFLTAREQVLMTRYNATKHRHPLYRDQGDSVQASLQRETAMLEPIRGQADHVLDTSDQPPHGLKARLLDALGIAEAPLDVQILSFSYQYGVPAHADLVMDVRFLHNPHYQSGLCDKTGLDDDVAAYIRTDPHYAGFMKRLIGLMQYLLPLYKAEGKSYLTVALGCTGGQHRSVCIARALAEALPTASLRVRLQHRELGIRPARL